jgi:GntR family transcriptional regulator/MocR family aminotransferase
MLELVFRPDRGDGRPLYRQLADHLRELVEAGRLAPGQKLPATRELAEAVGVSRNTVNLAYEALAEADLVSAHVGQGTFVAERSWAEREAGSADAPAGLAWEGLLSSRARALRVPAGLTRPPGQLPFDFDAGRVDLASLPRDELRRALGRAAGEHLDQLANRMDPLGWPPLREEIARALIARGIRCGPDDVLVVQGAQQGLDLTARVLIDAGDAVALEEPGYFGAHLAFAGHGAQLVPVPVDDRGLRTDALARVMRSRRLKLVYTTPAVQSPTGAALDEARRQALLALAAEHQVVIVEDDYDSELRLAGTVTPALKREDEAGRVVYLGTFSKVLFPALRVGYMVAAQPLLRRAVLARVAAQLGGSMLEQAALAELLQSGAIERHVRRVRRLYRERQDAMLAALDESFPSDARWRRPAGGNSVWVELPGDVDSDRLARAAREAGVGYGRGEPFQLQDTAPPCLLLSYACTEPDSIREGIGRLGEVITRAREEGTG